MKCFSKFCYDNKSNYKSIRSNMQVAICNTRAINKLIPYSRGFQSLRLWAFPQTKLSLLIPRCLWDHYYVI